MSAGLWAWAQSLSLIPTSRARRWQASRSGAGPCFLRPSHLQEALRHASGDQTLRLVSEVIQMMLGFEIPEDICPWICGASLMALRKPNGSISSRRNAS